MVQTASLNPFTSHWVKDISEQSPKSTICEVQSLWKTRPNWASAMSMGMKQVAPIKYILVHLFGQNY